MAVHQLHPDGTVSLVDDVCVSAEDPGFVRGEGVFETMTVSGGRALMLDAHLDRLARSARALEIPLPPRESLEALAAVVADPCVLRITVTRGGLTIAQTSELADHRAARTQGVTAVTLDLGLAADVRARSPWLLGGAKTTSYAVPMAGKREAERRGCDDAIWVSSDGEVLEATTSNVAWVRDGVLVTPPAEEVGILAGTTLAWALDQVPSQVRRARVDELLAAEEVLLTSSVRGVVGVVAIDGAAVGSGSVGPVTASLVKAFDELLLG